MSHSAFQANISKMLADALSTSHGVVYVRLSSAFNKESLENAFAMKGHASFSLSKKFLHVARCCQTLSLKVLMLISTTAMFFSVTYRFKS